MAPTPLRPWQINRRDSSWRCTPPERDAYDFHRSLPSYAPTRLVELPGLAAELGVGRLLVKDESDRFGLPSFKALGASWAVQRSLAEFAVSGATTFVAATDGNHGRAVARFARQLGHRAVVFVPRGVHRVATEAIVSEGADLHTVDDDYDAAVAAAAAYADGHDAILVQDTAWDGYELVPTWIVEGYGTLFVELDEQIAAAGVERADAVLVPTGVGSLLHAALVHHRSSDARAGTRVVSVEPDSAACVYASVSAGEPVSVPTGETTMAGLNCGTVSRLAWPLIDAGLDAALLATDAEALRAAGDMAAEGVEPGACGAAPIAALRVARQHDGAGVLFEHLQLGADATVVALSTESSRANPPR